MKDYNDIAFVCIIMHSSYCICIELCVFSIGTVCHNWEKLLVL